MDFCTLTYDLIIIFNFYSGGGGLALFGTGSLHTWARNVDEVSQRFTDNRKIDRRKFMDDSAYRLYSFFHFLVIKFTPSFPLQCIYFCKISWFLSNKFLQNSSDLVFVVSIYLNSEMITSIIAILILTNQKSRFKMIAFVVKAVYSYMFMYHPLMLDLIYMAILTQTHHLH